MGAPRPMMTSASLEAWSLAVAVDWTEVMSVPFDVQDLRPGHLRLHAGAPCFEAHVALFLDHADRVLVAVRRRACVPTA